MDTKIKEYIYFFIIKFKLWFKLSTRDLNKIDFNNNN